LHYGKDGSLALYVSHAAQSGDMRPNWLPAPEGEYVIFARIYGPKTGGNLRALEVAALAAFHHPGAATSPRIV
jgi:hypothetical protein